MADRKSFEKESMLCNTDNTDVEKHHSKEKSSTKQSTKYVLVSLIVLNIVSMIALFTLVVKWRVARQIALEPREQTVCLECKELGLLSEELPEEVKGKISREQRENSKEWVCCGYTSSILNRMVSQAIKQRDTGLGQECKTTTRRLPSAQVNGISISEMEHEGNKDIIYWKTSDTSFLKGGITYKAGKLTVKEPGYYYVFSQIKFRNIPQTTSKDDVTYGGTPTRLDHYMYRYARKTTKKILEASKSPCEIPSVNDETTSAIGAVFYWRNMTRYL